MLLLSLPMVGMLFLQLNACVFKWKVYLDAPIGQELKQQELMWSVLFIQVNWCKKVRFLNRFIGGLSGSDMK